MSQELIYGEPNVLSDLPEKYWRDVSAAMKRHSREPAIRMEELFMRTLLASFFETQLCQNLSYFSRP